MSDTQPGAHTHEHSHGDTQHTHTHIEHTHEHLEHTHDDTEHSHVHVHQVELPEAHEHTHA
jgi:hypothetical protein